MSVKTKPIPRSDRVLSPFVVCPGGHRKSVSGMGSIAQNEANFRAGCTNKATLPRRAEMDEGRRGGPLSTLRQTNPIRRRRGEKTIAKAGAWTIPPIARQLCQTKPIGPRDRYGRDPAKRPAQRPWGPIVRNKANSRAGAAWWRPIVQNEANFQVGTARRRRWGQSSMGILPMSRRAILALPARARRP